MRSNRATTAGTRLVDAFGRQMWDEVADCFSADAVNDDRRRGLSHLLDGREAVVTNLRTFSDLGAQGMTNEVVATRGDHLALVRREMVSAPGMDVEAAILVVEEADADGRIRVGILFDPDDLETALAELESRHAAS